MKRLMIVLAVAVAGLCPVMNAAEKPDGRVELSSVSRMESRTKDPKRDPGIFGDYWWANRFLSRHQEIEKVKGRSVDVVMLGDSIMHFWEWKHPESWAKFTAGRVALNLGYGGDRTQNVIWRIEHGEQAQQVLVAIQGVGLAQRDVQVNTWRGREHLVEEAVDGGRVQTLQTQQLNYLLACLPFSTFSEHA